MKNAKPPHPNPPPEYQGRGQLLLMAALFLVLVVGCKRRGQAVSGSLPATAQAAGVHQGANVMLMLDGAPVAFPPISLRARATGGGVAVRLSTPAADGEKGNSLFFDLMLEDVEDPANLAGATWHFRSDDRERADTLNGLGL